MIYNHHQTLLAYVTVRKPEGKRSFGSWVYVGVNTEIGLQKTGEGMDWIQLA
jgi:hypothetical protein